MSSKSKSKEITEEMVTTVKNLIGERDEVNLEWLLIVTQMPITTLSKIIIQKIGMVILEKTIYSKAKAEKKLRQKQ